MPTWIAAAAVLMLLDPNQVTVIVHGGSVRIAAGSPAAPWTLVLLRLPEGAALPDPFDGQAAVQVDGRTVRVAPAGAPPIELHAIAAAVYTGLQAGFDDLPEHGVDPAPDDPAEGLSPEQLLELLDDGIEYPDYDDPAGGGGATCPETSSCSKSCSRGTCTANCFHGRAKCACDARGVPLCHCAIC